MARRTRVIVGLGATGLSYVRYLAARGERFAVFDDAPDESRVRLLREVDAAAEVLPLNAMPVSEVQEIYLSPGVPLAHPVMQSAQGQGARVRGDIEIFGELADSPVIAITGTNGKSTVAHLVHAHLARQLPGQEVVLAGNVGTPALDVLSPGADCYVVEVSSYQLELASQLAADVAVVLNLSPDHLDRYADLNAYYQTKLALYDHCKGAVVNRALLDQVAIAGRKFATFGQDLVQGEQHFGLLHVDGKCFLAQGDEPLLGADELQIAGIHNLENALASLAVGWVHGLDMPQMLESLRDFSGLPHRGELVRVRRDVRYVNDSKATNPAAMTVAATGQKSPVHLIAGGLTKELDFVQAVSRVGSSLSSLALIGDSRELMASQLEDMPVKPCASMSEAVAWCAGRASAGDTVLLSPGCASHDQYENFAERGNAFREAVEELGS